MSAAAGHVFNAVGSVISARGAYHQGKARAKALRADALEARNAATSEAGAIELRAREALAQGAVTAAASGFTVDGSALDVLGWMAQQHDADARTVRRDGAIQAARLRNEAAQAAYQGRIGAVTGLMQAGSSLMAAHGARKGS
jgi:hypothetical protein